MSDARFDKDIIANKGKENKTVKAIEWKPIQVIRPEKTQENMD